ncbi:MAG: hypothetical protein RIQ59_322 [Bacteroidota bacterium]|jgi:hypothetical protein
MKNKEKVSVVITATIESNGKQVNFKVISEDHLVMLDPNDHLTEIANIMIDENGIATTKSLNASRWPEDAGKCLLECSRGCNGSLTCVAGCAATCATIIIG